MVNRTVTALLAAAFLGLQCVPGPAWAENAMGYRLLSAREAAALPRGGGALGMDVRGGPRITDGGMAFALMRVTGVRRGSPAARAGFHVGDQIIAADGQVFPSTDAFAAYVASVQPGGQISVDYMPAGGGPQQAQRVAVRVGGAGGRAAPAQSEEARTGGLSTGTKLAIGAGAAALLCYKFGCLSRLRGESGGAGQQQAPGGFLPQR